MYSISHLAIIALYHEQNPSTKCYAYTVAAYIYQIQSGAKNFPTVLINKWKEVFGSLNL